MLLYSTKYKLFGKNTYYTAHNIPLPPVLDHLQNSDKYNQYTQK